MLIYGVDYMIANYCELSEAYNKIVSECYSPGEAFIKIRCGEYLNEYCRRKRKNIGLADEHFFIDYFTKWLAYKVCMEDKSVIEAFYPSADEYVRLTDMLNGTSVYSRFKLLDPKIKYESVRLMLLKRSIMEFNNSFIISKMPCIIDLDKYRQKMTQKDCEYERDSGRFKVESVFSKNSVVMSKINGCEYFIRLFFNPEVIELVEENDIFDISVVKDGGRWKLDDINGCYNKQGKSFI